MPACRSSSENTRKMQLKPILNKISPRAHTDLEFDVFGIPGKLMKYVVHLSKRNFKNKLYFFIQAAQTAMNQFLVSQGI
jgi:hypothetical protein